MYILFAPTPKLFFLFLIFFLFNLINHTMMIESWNPPLLHHYSKLSRLHSSSRDNDGGANLSTDQKVMMKECELSLIDLNGLKSEDDRGKIRCQLHSSIHDNDGGANLSADQKVMMEEWELPLIDLNGLKSEDEREKTRCEDAIARASSEWGFFQVVNHGVSLELLKKMRREQMKLFKAPFEMKASCGLLNNSYRWGNSTATCPKQFSWSEAFHIPLTKISEAASYGEFTTLREVMVEYATSMQDLAKSLAGVLVRKLGQKDSEIREICNESSCFLRLNHYPSCQISQEIFGLVPHTDSDFLTILDQDEVGGLQLMKDSKWVAVKPNQNALIVNIGDLFQAWSNDVYKSVEHKVMANGKMERFSIAYFLCPSYDSLIGSCKEPSIYKKFTFGEYRSQIQQDVKLIGHKVGLSRFLL